MNTATRQALRSDPRSTPDRPACDCTNYCGDDPNVFNGKAQPCQASAALQAKREEASEHLLLAFELADKWAHEVLASATTEVLDNGHPYADTKPKHLKGDKAELADIAKAARFLVLGKRAEQHPTKPHLLRIL